MLQTRFKEDTVVEVGIDEAGRGSFFGPIMAGAVVWPPQSSWTPEIEKLSLELRDSKKIAPKKRERIADDIKRLAVAWHVGSVSNTEIDEQGITWANQEAFRRAVTGLRDQKGLKGIQDEKRLLIDGELTIHGYDGEQHVIVDGDAIYMSIAAASILAKVEHDRWITDWCDANSVEAEKYSLRTSKGYGTAAHRAGLVANGAHSLHRRTFVRKYVPADQALPKPNVVIQGYFKQTVEKCLIRL
uniref:Ribonuclease HII n=1 Tax=viral metagenome TaxID=1070528 RepID=A0A6C0AQP4_9ZZZZ